VALVLAIVGVCGLMSHAVTQRTREIAIRMAIGAAPSHVLAAVLQQSLMLTGIGAAMGMLVAAGLISYLKRLFEPGRPTDVRCGGSAVTGGRIDGSVPAGPPRRRVDPLVALRYDQ
jgi:ABC-type antimicrobial peptide transport system permease subunit